MRELKLIKINTFSCTFFLSHLHLQQIFNMKTTPLKLYAVGFLLTFENIYNFNIKYLKKRKINQV